MGLEHRAMFAERRTGRTEIRIAAEAGLRRVLSACATMIYSKRFLDYARLAAADPSLGVGANFFDKGPLTLTRTIEKYLEADECRVVFNVASSALAAEQLMCILLGPSFLRVLLRGDDLVAEEIVALVDAALGAFTAAYGDAGKGQSDEQ